MSMRDILGGGENVLKLIIVMAEPLSKVTKNHLIIHLKWMNFMMYKIYLNKSVKIGKEQ